MRQTAALVVQRGVEFGVEAVIKYDRTDDDGLACFFETVPSLIFETHSTDYQTRLASSQSKKPAISKPMTTRGTGIYLFLR